MMLPVLVLMAAGGPGDAPAVPAAPVAPVAVVIATSRGQQAVPVSLSLGYPALAAGKLSALLPMSSQIEQDWATVDFAGQQFRFLLGAPLFQFQNRIVHLVGGAFVQRDSLYLPLQWLAEYVPRVFQEAYRYDPLAARFEELGVTRVATRVSQPAGPTPRQSDVPAAARAVGLSARHRVTIDPGHGGRDPGTTGHGVHEKNLALAIGLAVREALRDRGVDVTMTRTTDVLVPLSRRASKCNADCDLFVSVHVNAPPSNSSRYRGLAGLEAYFFDYRDPDGAPDRIAARENESLRYESETDEIDDDDPLGFILRDLEENEYIRESAQLADLIVDMAGGVHPSGSRKVAQDNFEVLRRAGRPAILIETGYITNATDNRFLTSADGQRRLAGAIADGIVEYLKNYENKVSQ